MSENAETKKEIPIMEKLDSEKGEHIVNEVLEKMKHMMELKIYELKILPWRFMTIPGLQRFSMAMYKFRKYIGKDYIIFADKEMAIKYNSDSVEVFIRARRTNKIYHKVFYNDYEIPPALIPRYSDLVDSGDASIDAVTPEEVVKKIFGINISLAPWEVYRQGHLYAIRVNWVDNIEKWFTESLVYKIFNHELKEYYANALTNEIYFLHYSEWLTIESQHHGVGLLPFGQWILYHPEVVD